MYGSKITFTKQSATNTYTINAGTGNFFRFIRSNSSTTQTSTSMLSNFTILNLVETQSTIWDVIISNNSTKVNTSLITANTTISFPFKNNYSIATGTTTAITLTIPSATIALLGSKILFKRTNTVLSQVNSSISISGLTNVGTTILLSTAQYQREIVQLMHAAYIIRQN